MDSLNVRSERSSWRCSLVLIVFLRCLMPIPDLDGIDG
jgi:hypothetical protein